MHTEDHVQEPKPQIAQGSLVALAIQNGVIRGGQDMTLILIPCITNNTSVNKAICQCLEL